MQKPMPISSKSLRIIDNAELAPEGAIELSEENSDWIRQYAEERGCSLESALAEIIAGFIDERPDE